MEKEFGLDYSSIEDVGFTAKYRASCFCNTVQYEVCSDPVDAKICHCLACQKLHGAPMQWAAIFHKRDVRIIEGIEHLHFSTMNSISMRESFPAKSVVPCVAPLLLMRVVICGLHSHHSSILDSCQRFQQNSGQLVISSMVLELSI